MSSSSNVIKNIIDFFWVALPSFFNQRIIDIYQTSNDLTTQLKIDQGFQFQFLKTLLMFCIIFVLIILIMLQTTIKDTFTTKSYLYMSAIVISLSFLFITQEIIKDFVVSKGWTIGIFIFGCIGYYLYHYFSKLSTGSQLFISIILYFCLGLVVIIALSIIFSIFMKYFKSMNGIMGFLVYFLFYIPCLFIDFIAYLKNELKMTSNIVLVLFVLEIIVVLLYLYLPSLFDKITKSADSVVLLREAVFLDSSKVIGNADLLAFTPNELKISKPSVIIDETNQGTIYRKEYGLSMWIYLNTQPLHQTTYSNEVNIFDLGNGKPTIAYMNNTSDTSSDITKDKFVIYFTDAKTDDGRFEISLEKQKWHNIVFNYHGNSADLFIDGTIARSVTFNADNFPSYKPSDLITIGSKNGLYGAICNIYMSKHPISHTQVARTYNLLMFENPPYIRT